MDLQGRGRKNVPKTILWGKAYFRKVHINRLFSARNENSEITEWYSVEDIQQKYGMTLSAIYSLVSKVGIPKRKDGPKYAKIATNSAAGYWSTFRALLKMAYKEGLLNENLNDHLESIDWEEPRINFLEIEEIRKLAATSCKVDVLKRASLFACLTGLRISDILQLKWDNIEVSPDGGHCMRICTQKTKTQATLPLSEEALSYCGEPNRGLVFKGLSRAHTREPFKSWLKAAGITKKITFHGLRHTYATLLITNGTDIYTVSKMLTHKNVATTQIYAEVVNQKKRDAANSITLK